MGPVRGEVIDPSTAVEQGVDSRPSPARSTRVHISLPAVCAALVTILDLSDGYPELFQFTFLELPLWIVGWLLWLAWVRRGVTHRGVNHHPGRGPAIAIVPALFLGTMLMVWTHVPVTVRFELSKDALAAFADHLEEGHAPAAGTVGLFQVDWAWADAPGVEMGIGAVGFLDTLSLVRDGSREHCDEWLALDERWTLCYDMD